MNNKIEVCTITEDFISHDYVKPLAYEWIENLMYFLFIYPLVAFISEAINKNSSMTYLGLGLLIPILLMTYLRVTVVKKRNFLLGIVGVLLLSTAVIIGIGKQYFLEGILILWVISCIKKSSSKQNFQFNLSKLVGFEIALVFEIILPAAFKFSDIQVMTLVIAIFIMILAIAYICKARNTKLVMDNKKSGGFKRKNSNMFLIEIVLLIAITMGTLFGLGVFGKAYDLTRQISKAMLEYEQSNHKINLPDHDPRKNNDNQNKEQIPPEIVNKVQTPPSTLRIIIGYIFKILFKLIAIIAVLAISYLVLNSILLALKKFKNQEKVTFVFNKVMEVEEKEKFEKKKSSIRTTLFLNDRDKVRKIYKHKILKYKKNKITINNYYSVNEIKKEILNSTSDNLDEVTAIYEKARYSNKDVTKEEVELIKNSGNR